MKNTTWSDMQIDPKRKKNGSNLNIFSYDQNDLNIFSYFLIWSELKIEKTNFDGFGYN